MSPVILITKRLLEASCFLFLLLLLNSCNPSSKDQSVSDTLILTSEFIYDQADFPSCHASTIVETPAGLIAAWFGGTHEKHEDVEIYISRRVDGSWTKPVSVADGVQHAGKRYPCWNPVLFQYPGGPLMLFYKVGPNPREWWGMLKRSEDNGKTWSEAIRLPEDILGPVKNKPVLLNDNILLCPSSTETAERWQMHFEITEDMGKTWRITGPVDDEGKYNIIQPSVLFHKDGRLQILARSKEDYIISSWSSDGGTSWSLPEPSVLPNPNSGTDAVTLQNGLQLLVYNHSFKTEGKWGGPRTPLNVAVSEDGINWKMLVVLEDEPGEFSYPAVIQGKDGVVHISYTWNREKIKYVALNAGKIDYLKATDIKIQ